jgi:hypothetical protein
VRAAQLALTLTEKLALPAQLTVQHLVNAELWLDLGALKLARETLESTHEHLTSSNLQAYTLPLETLRARLEFESGELATAHSRLEPLIGLADRSPPEQRTAFVCVYARTLMDLGEVSSAINLIAHLDPPQWMQARLEGVRQMTAQIPTTPERLRPILEHAPPLERLELLCTLPDSKANRLEIERLEHQLTSSLEDHPELRKFFLTRLGTLRERGMAHDALRSEP